MTIKYWIYRSLKGSGLGKRRVSGIIFDNLAEAEAFVEKQDALLPNAEHRIIEKRYGEDRQ